MFTDAGGEVNWNAACAAICDALMLLLPAFAVGKDGSKKPWLCCLAWPRSCCPPMPREVVRGVRPPSIEARTGYRGSAGRAGGGRGLPPEVEGRTGCCPKYDDVVLGGKRAG